MTPLVNLSKSRNDRRHMAPKQSTKSGDARTPGQRDRDRILYSSAFRRLAGVTQIASPFELTPVHNRLIHSLKVAQVGRALTVTLLNQAAGDTAISAALARAGGMDPDVVEAACLAHDLGHPPFGHVAEETLDHLLVSGGTRRGVPDGFNGNAQTFRIVCKLSIRTDLHRGLDLTRATLGGILKYPWVRSSQGERHDKWGAYESETEDFDWARTGAVEALNSKSIEAALMDWADDITYAVHDVEDFFRAGLIPLDRLTSEEQEQVRFIDWSVLKGKIREDEQDTLRDAFLRTEFVNPGAPRGPFRGTWSDRAWLRTMTSDAIGRYVRDSVALEVHEDRIRLRIRADHEDEVRMLKNLAWRYVIESPSLVTQRYGQRALITSLFETFTDAVAKGEYSIFPSFFQADLESSDGDPKVTKRIVADLISSMSEAQAIAINQRLTGQSLGSATDAYLQ
jgi:dGTPase